MEEKYKNPIRVLAEELGNVEYPIRKKYIILRIFFIILPCSTLISLAYIFPSLNSLLLTFAGAFASIQLITPYQKYSEIWRNFFINSRKDLGEKIFPYLRKKLIFQLKPSITQIETQLIPNDNGYRLINTATSHGYSPLQLRIARIRFQRIAKKWDKYFLKLNGPLLQI